MDLPRELTQTTAKPRRSLDAVLADIEKFASWGPPPPTDLEDVIAECRKNYPDEEAQVHSRIGRGEERRKLLAPFYSIGIKHGKDSEVARQQLRHLANTRPDCIYAAKKQLDKGNIARRRNDQVREKRQQGAPASRIKPRQHHADALLAPVPSPSRRTLPEAAPLRLHPQDLRGLEPSPNWILLIDETGNTFDTSAFALHPEDSKLGRLVGLLLPENHGLKPLPRGWHAVDKDTDEIDDVIQHILDLPTGVIGITVQQLPSAPMGLWTFGVLRLIDLVLRLLPLNGPTNLAIQIEQRSEFRGGTEWNAVASAAVLALSQTYPERASQIYCKIKIIGKEDSEFNGYVDALAYVWAGASPYSRACLRNSKLIGTCFLPGDVSTITRTWEWIDRGITLDGADWATLLKQPESNLDSSLTSTILERLGQASQGDTRLWERYLTHTLSHLDSKAVDLGNLSREVEWLERWQPPGRSLPPTVRLIWLTTKLARANHLGHAEQPWLNELQVLAEGLLDENAHLVCRADLHLAVNATNRYEFEIASSVLKRWHDQPKQVPGLRLWAQVQSSLGQHSAFDGRTADAVAFFDVALCAFAKLSDIREGQREAIQTLTYRAISMMDDSRTPQAEVIRAVESVTGPLTSAIPRLAGSVADHEKYLQHTLTRYLALRADPQTSALYLKHRDEWGTGQGHPWPLIQLYRAMLLQENDPENACELALEGFELAVDEDQGPVVRLVGACIRAIAVSWGLPWSAQQSDTLLSAIELGLPVAKARIEKVREFMVAPGNPHTLLREVLPFNFH